MNFDNLRIVLVEPTHPGNIGAVARVMKNMGLTRLVLVNPLLFPHADATARAAGGTDVLMRAQVVETFDAALAGCRQVLGTSARRRGVSGPELDPRRCAAGIAEFSDRAEVALVFGRESSGLTNDEMDRCHHSVRIPTAPAFSSLNLATAVAVLAYELRLAADGGTISEAEAGGSERPAPVEDVEHFYRHLEDVLLMTGFLDPANPRHLMRRLRRLFNRARPSENDVHILRGILTSVQAFRRGQEG
jgi:TrmH family RNA methyltransferase